MADFPDWTVPTNIQNPSINVQVQGGNIDANITNALINANIKQSEVTLDVGDLRFRGDEVTLGEDPTASPSVYHALNADECKVIVHGAQGFLESVTIYLRNSGTSDYDVQVELRYHPLGPAVYVYTITVAAGFEGWKSFRPQIYWPWDTICIFLKSAGTDDVSVGAVGGPPYDTIRLDGTFWGWVSSRILAYVKVLTKSVFSVAVAGTVTALRPPAKQYYFNKDWVSADPSSEVTILTIKGRGRLRYILWIVADAGFADSVLRIYADGNVVTGYYFDGPGTLNYYGLLDKPTQPRLLKYDPNKPEAILCWNEEVEFHRELRLALHNYDSSN